MTQIRAKVDIRGVDSKIIEDIQRQYNIILVQRVIPIRKNIQELIVRAIKSTPEYQSLLGGTLQAELGVPNPGDIEGIIQQWAHGVVVKINKLRKKRGGLEGGLRIDLIQPDFKDVINLPQAIYYTDKGERIPWLEWLLLEGSNYIIRDYQIGIDFTGVSRTGLGKIMIHEKRGGPGWRVPQQFAGTRNNNFVTRALEGIQPQLEAIIEGGLSVK